MLRPTASAALTLPLCLLCLACSGAGLQRPTASFKGAQVRDVTAAGFTADFDIDVKNPNAIALPLANADYRISLGGVKVVDGAAKPDASLPAGGSLLVTLPVNFTFESLLRAEEAIRTGGGGVPYEFDGAVDFAGKSDSLLGLGGTSLRVPVRASGVLDLREVFKNPAVYLNNPAARRLAGRVLGDIFNR
jgi:hypothetical protein